MSKVNAVATPVALGDAAREFSRALGSVHPAVVAVAVAHSAFETGYWLHCYNWNLGNAKSGGVSGDWCFYACGEELPLSSAQQYVKNDPSLVYIVKQYDRVGKPYASVSFMPEHPMCRFQAFDSLKAGVDAHLAMLQKSFPKSYAALQTGDVELYCRVLAAEGYYTADVNKYTSGVCDVYTHVVNEMLLPKPGESGGAHIWRIVQYFAGCSIHHRHWDLRFLATQCEDHPDQEMLRTTNCATSARWIYKLAACAVNGLFAPDEVMRAANPAGPISWLITAAKAQGALVDGKRWKEAGKGWLLYYAVGNNAHVEWCGGVPDDSGVVSHGGGGRADNAITVATGDIRTSWNRPLVYMIDPAAMKVPNGPVAEDGDQPTSGIRAEDAKNNPVAVSPEVGTNLSKATANSAIAVMLAAILAYLAHC